MLPRPTASDRLSFAKAQRQAGVDLADDWLNDGPMLFALCDRGTDLPDCITLAPTAEELAECVPWLELQDGTKLWPAHVRATIADLARRLGHGV